MAWPQFTILLTRDEPSGPPGVDNQGVGLGRELTVLENSVLGVLFKLQPCRAHAVVLELGSSQTTAYRSKAGSIYPLVARLARAGLLHYEGRKYRLSEEGMSALRNWVRPPIPSGEVSTSLDQIRSRAYFLEILPPAEVFEFLDCAEAELNALLKNLQSRAHEHVDAGDRFGELAYMGALRETEARIGWIQTMRSELKREYPVAKEG